MRSARGSAWPVEAPNRLNINKGAIKILCVRIVFALNKVNGLDGLHDCGNDLYVAHEDSLDRHAPFYDVLDGYCDHLDEDFDVLRDLHESCFDVIGGSHDQLYAAAGHHEVQPAQQSFLPQTVHLSSLGGALHTQLLDPINPY
uniref:Uncharacterized protein n=1 Tax=Magnetococcus massalia (strain MO-1) TaxID=451514 RepID=A0A1S7LIW8_MAGMO|nr:Protein of unknown function [Candidatus Magnetococcus massalia]